MAGSKVTFTIRLSSITDTITVIISYDFEFYGYFFVDYDLGYDKKLWIFYCSL